MKIALAQINPRIADLGGNLRLAIKAAKEAASLGADLAVFPEQALGGYPALDLWEDPSFLKAGERALAELARATREIAVVIGAPTRNKGRLGKPLFNSAAFLRRGGVEALRHKTLLPTYDVFDERRYFEPAPSNEIVRFKGKRIGLSVCEDALSSLSAGGRPLYDADPVRDQIRAGADLLINIAASPFERGKLAKRIAALSAYAKSGAVPLISVNLVGGNDELVFDGRSLALDSRGRLADVSAGFREDLRIVDTDSLKPLARPPEDGIEEIARALILGISDFVRKCGFERALVGLSGGIDSSVVLCLAAEALGAGKVTGVAMPSSFNAPESLADARALAARAGARFLEVPIEGLRKAYSQTLRRLFPGGPPAAAGENLQARIRANLLMALANAEGGLVLSTGNKSEMALGYSTLYGDMAGALCVLSDATKKTVYELAAWINSRKPLIPENSIRRAPTAELRPGQKDEDDIPPYKVLDAVLKAHIEEGRGLDSLLREGFKRKTLDEILSRHRSSEFKRRQAPPGLKISPKAFGVGRRLPIARGDYSSFT